LRSETLACEQEADFVGVRHTLHVLVDAAGRDRLQRTDFSVNQVVRIAVIAEYSDRWSKTRFNVAKSRVCRVRVDEFVSSHDKCLIFAKFYPTA